MQPLRFGRVFGIPLEARVSFLVMLGLVLLFMGGLSGIFIVLLAFSSVANAGVLSASRYPLAMGRDRLLPEAFGRIGSRGTPTLGIAVTVGLILVSVTVFDPSKIAICPAACDRLKETTGGVIEYMIGCKTLIR